MPLPLVAVAPAIAATVAYLNARSSAWYDLLLLNCALTGAARMYYRERVDRLNLFYAFESTATAKSTSNHTLLIFEGKRFSYAEAYDKVLRYGHYLKTKLGVKPKDIVAMDFQNSEQFVFLWLGLWSIGAKPAFINYNLTGASLAHCLRAATTKLCIIDPNVSENVNDAVKTELTDITFVVLDSKVEAKILAMDPVRAPDSDRSEDKLSNMSILIYTSGTTGMPKPAVVSWGKCIVGGSVTQRLLGRGNKDVMYTSMPLYHSSAAVLSFCSTLLAGSTQAIGRKFSTKSFWAEVRDSEATTIQYVGETLRYLLAAPPQHDPLTGECLDKQHKVQIAFGNGLRPDIWNEFKDRFGIEAICEFYAATEGTFGTWNLCKNDFTAGAIGRNGWLYNVLVGINVALVKVDFDTDLPWRDPKTGRCKKVKNGDPGEMLFRLPSGDPFSRFQGYYNNKEATAAKVMRDVFSKGDAWFRTGDVGRWDNEGRVFFHDRIGDTFRWKSENVSTAEVSHAVCMHPSVKEANVYGVALPHHDGRAGCAAIFLASAPTKEVMRSLAGHVKENLPKFAQPIFLRVMSKMGGGQITGTNKQQKHALREIGADPSKGEGTVFWLKGNQYVEFRNEDWKELDGGQVKL
ncbi:Fc.00g054530.m01.CDS01 [Cosmosporella sp. VM-42]